METISGNFLTSSLTEEFLINPSYLQNDQVLQQVIFDQIDSFFFWLNQNVSTFWHLRWRKNFWSILRIDQKRIESFLLTTIKYCNRLFFIRLILSSFDWTKMCQLFDISLTEKDWILLTYRTIKYCKRLFLIRLILIFFNWTKMCQLIDIGSYTFWMSNCFTSKLVRKLEKLMTIGKKCIDPIKINLYQR